MSSYKYRGLKHADSIRLFELLPASDPTSPIVCNLLHTRFAERPSYEAISYTWGEDTAVHRIYVDGGKNLLEVRTNCYNLLYHIRSTNRARVLWIDAICIDQTSLNERGHRVRMMDVIYAKASSVVVHLGEHSDGSEALFEEFAREARWSTWRSGSDPRHPKTAIVNSHDCLLQRPWFRRVCILPEVSRNQNIFFMCGSGRVSKDSLVDRIMDHRKMRASRSAIPDACEPLLVEESDSRLSLWTLLVNSARFLATDPRDKVFALQSLMRCGRDRAAMDSLIDYSQSVVQTFINTTLFLLPAVGLRVLRINRHPHEMIMPSWIPDSSQTVPQQELYWSMVYYIREQIAKMLDRNTGGRGFFEVLHDSGMPLLKVPGTRLAKIRYRDPVSSFKNFQDANDQQRDLDRHVLNMSYFIPNTELSEDVRSDPILDKRCLFGECTHNILGYGPNV
jgi:hypothetical protein